jgi:hypothetical protein
MHAKMIEKHGAGIWVSRVWATFDVKSEGLGPQLGEIVGMATYSENNIWRKIIDAARHLFGNDMKGGVV